MDKNTDDGRKTSRRATRGKNPISRVLYLPRWVKLQGHTGARASGQYTATLIVEQAAMADAHY